MRLLRYSLRSLLEMMRHLIDVVKKREKPVIAIPQSGRSNPLTPKRLLRYSLLSVLEMMRNHK
jgi:uncharacterized UPF0146 family protein